jgi:sugar phosphate isomerase/epimerase
VNQKITEATRREFLRAAGVGVVGGVLATQLPITAFGADNPYAPFRMGIQSYSLRAFKTEEALKKTQELGLKYWEAYPGHFAVTEDDQMIRLYKQLLKKYDVRLVTYGVVEFHNSEEEARRIFNFARKMGIETLSAYPKPNEFSMLDNLVSEYKINIAIHNHGPGDDLYDMISKGIKAVQGRDDRIGSCNDTGHYLRSNEDPVEAAKQFGKRTFGIHLKDVKDGANGAKDFTELGKGNLKTVELLKVLLANNYKGILSLEYEEHPENPMAQIQECLQATRAAITKATKR